MLFTALTNLATPELKAAAARLTELKAELQPKQNYVSWVGDYFWAEARNRNPVLNDHDNISIRADWSIVAEHGDHHDGHGLAEMLGALSLGGGLGFGRGGRHREPLNS